MSNSYENRLRVRSCGILAEEGKVLLVELFSPVTNQWTWIPPGGGVEFGESLEQALIREYKEETGLLISPKKRIHIKEVIQPPIHAIEFYYRVERVEGTMKLGLDPEMNAKDQILRDIKFLSKEDISRMNVAPEFIKSELWSLI